MGPRLQKGEIPNESFNYNLVMVMIGSSNKEKDYKNKNV